MMEIGPPRPPRQWTAEILFTSEGSPLPPISVRVTGNTIETATYQAVLRARASLPRGTRVQTVTVNLGPA